MDGNRLYELLERIGNLLRAEERRGAASLQPVQLHALAYLDRCNRYSDSPAAVTEYLGITKGTASQTLKRLRDRGLVASRPDPDDGRRMHLRLTPKGRRTLDASLPRELLDAALADVTVGSDELERALTQLLAGLQRAHGGRPFGVCATCRYFTKLPGGDTQCGLTGEPLSADDATRLCREYESVHA